MYALFVLYFHRESCEQQKKDVYHRTSKKIKRTNLTFKSVLSHILYIAFNFALYFMAFTHNKTNESLSFIYSLSAVLY